MKMSGFCAFPSPGSHGYCHETRVARGRPCDCLCHTADTPPSSAGFEEAVSTPRVVPGPPPATHAKVKLEITQADIDRAMLEEPVNPHGIRLPSHDSTVTIDLPPLFYDDHVGRGLLTGRVVKRLTRNTRVELDAAAYDDLRVDAQYYVEMAEEFNLTVPNVVISARATLRALDKAGRPS